jgi:hypothetical protein
MLNFQSRSPNDWFEIAPGKHAVSAIPDFRVGLGHEKSPDGWLSIGT